MSVVTNPGDTPETTDEWADERQFRVSRELVWAATAYFEVLVLERFDGIDALEALEERADALITIGQQMGRLFDHVHAVALPRAEQDAASRALSELLFG